MTATELRQIANEEVEAAMKADGVWPDFLWCSLQYEWHINNQPVDPAHAESLLAWPLVRWLAGKDGVDWVTVSNHPPCVGIEHAIDSDYTNIGKIGSTYFTALVAAYMAERGRK